MSPEQAGAEPDVDTRSAVYSLGAVLYEMLTGLPPLGTDTFRHAACTEVMRLIHEIEHTRRTGHRGGLRAAVAHRATSTAS